MQLAPELHEHPEDGAGEASVLFGEDLGDVVVHAHDWEQLLVLFPGCN